MKTLSPGSLALCAAFACAPPAPETDAGAEPDDTVQPTLGDIQARILTPGCSLASCHGGTNPKRGLLLTEGNARAELVGRHSTYSRDGGTLILVVAGAPEASFLMDKLEKSDEQLRDERHGLRMPYGGSPLPADRIDAIRQWIAQGAMDN